MEQQKARDIMSGRRRGFGASALRALTWILAKPYAWLLRLRRWAYRKGLLPSRKVGAVVISVGNLTAGGTGKTPMVAWLVERLKAAGRDAAILTRGYKAGAGRPDEAALLERLADVPVIVNPDRVAGAHAAVAGGADVLVMDDGFQHLRLRRDLDIVLIDATKPFGFGHVLPRGLLREPLSALRDADAVVITRSDLIGPGQLDRLRQRIVRLAPRASVHLAVHQPVGIIDGAGENLSLSELSDKRVCAFCGIGNPGAFFATLESVGAELVERIAFDDHVVYDTTALARVAESARSCRAELLVTTHKDRVKLDRGVLPVPVWTLRIAMTIVSGEAGLMEKIRSVCA